MFVVKFVSSYKEDDDTWTETTSAICCDHYEVLRRANGSIAVTTYPSHLEKEGVERQIYKNTGFDCFFIENMAGKTIDSGRYVEVKTN
jgi:hypothetical protein